MSSQVQRGDYVEFIAGTHKGVRGRVIMTFRGWITVMQDDHVTVSDVVQHAVKIDPPAPQTATAERCERSAVS